MKRPAGSLKKCRRGISTVTRHGMRKSGGGHAPEHPFPASRPRRPPCCSMQLTGAEKRVSTTNSNSGAPIASPRRPCRLFQSAGLGKANAFRVRRTDPPADENRDSQVSFGVRTASLELGPYRAIFRHKPTNRAPNCRASVQRRQSHGEFRVTSVHPLTASPAADSFAGGGYRLQPSGRRQFLTAVRPPLPGRPRAVPTGD